MINKPTYGEVKSQLKLSLEDITKTVQSNATFLRSMHINLKAMFSGYGSDAKIFYILRQTVYQKNGYAYITGSVKRALLKDFEEKNPNALNETRYAIERATGVRVSDSAIEGAIARTIKGSVESWQVRDEILQHTNRELEKVIGG